MDIVELLNQAHLVDVRLIEREARLKLDPRPDAGLSKEPELEEGGSLNIDVNPVSWGKRIETWFRMRLENSAATISCAVAVIYDREDNAPLSQELRKDFIEKISVMAAYPYLRAEVQHQVSDLGLGGFTLDLLRQGQFKIQDPAPDEADPPTAADSD